MNPLPSIADRALNESAVSNLREPAFELLSRIQDFNPSDQVRALFLTCAVIADTLGMDPYEAIRRALRMIEQADAPHTVHIGALKDYAANELRRVE